MHASAPGPSLSSSDMMRELRLIRDVLDVLWRWKARPNVGLPVFSRQRRTSTNRPISAHVVLLSDVYTGRVTASTG